MPHTQLQWNVADSISAALHSTGACSYSSANKMLIILRGPLRPRTENAPREVQVPAPSSSGGAIVFRSLTDSNTDVSTFEVPGP